MNRSRTPLSLTRRFIVASVLLLPLFLGLTGYFLDQAFQQSLAVAEQERLKTQLYLLLADAELEGDKLGMPAGFQEPRFNQLKSGLYGVVLDAGHNEVWRSASARLLPSALNSFVQPLTAGQRLFGHLQIEGEPFFIYSFAVQWESPAAQAMPFQFVVLQHKAAYEKTITRYRRVLTNWLGAVALLFVIAQLLILRWSLRPLDKLAQELNAVESGEQVQLQGHYPVEIQPVTTNLNTLLEHERSLRQRYRNTLSDLAHSLKTPLAVMQGLLGKNSEQELQMQEQLQRMDDIVAHQLRRSVVSQQGGIAQAVSVKATVERIVASLLKIYRDPGKRITIEIAEDITFDGDERDLMEVLGNIIENAFKYGREKIRVGAVAMEQQLTIEVEDDGPGVAEQDMAYILRRGARGDTALPGQGIGLAVATDIVSSYGGAVSVEKGSWGGAKFCLVFVQGGA